MSVVDGAGRALDPVNVQLVRLGAGADDPDRLMGRYVTRGGLLSVEGVVPGRYRLEASAQGHAPVTTEPFEVPDQGWVDAGTVQMLKMAFLRITGSRDASGRMPGVDVEITVAEGEDPPRRIWLSGRDLPVRPGPVTVAARALAGPEMTFQQTLDVEEGSVASLRIDLR